MRSTPTSMLLLVSLCGCPKDCGPETGSSTAEDTSTGGSVDTTGPGDTTSSSDTTSPGDTTSETGVTSETGSETTGTTGGTGSTDTSGDSGSTGAPGCVADEFDVTGPVAVTPASTSVTMYDPPIALSASGRPVIAWQEQHSLDWLAFDASLAPVTDVVVALADDAHSPGLGFADDGHFMVAWGDPNLAPLVMFQLYASDGAPLAAPIEANQVEMNEPYIHGTGIAAAINGAGELALVWGESSDGFIIVRRFAADGGPLGDELEIDPVATRLLTGPPQVAIDDLGRTLVVWGDSLPPQAGHFAQHLGPDGLPSGPRITLYQPGEGLFYPPAVHMAPDDRAVASFYLQDAGQVFVQRFAAGGEPIGEPVQANDVPANDPLALDGSKPHAGTLAVDADASFVVGWMTNEPQQYIRRFTADGKPLGPAIPLCPPHPPRGAPSLAVAGGRIALGQVLLEPEPRLYVSLLDP